MNYTLYFKYLLLSIIIYIDIIIYIFTFILTDTLSKIETRKHLSANVLQSQPQRKSPLEGSRSITLLTPISAAQTATFFFDTQVKSPQALPVVTAGLHVSPKL